MTHSLTYPEQWLARGFWDSFADALEAAPGDRLRYARRAYAQYRAAHGFKAAAADMLTSPDAQPKLGKSKDRPAYGLMLVPQGGLPAEFWPGSRPVNLCPAASAGCAAACLAYAGKGAMNTVQRARAVRTGFMLAHPRAAGTLLGHEVQRALLKHGPISLRMNVLSDIRWELLPGFERAALAATSMGVQFYDYTAFKPAMRGMDALRRVDYRLTFSAKESAATSDDYLTGLLERGSTVAMPFNVRKGQPLPEQWHGFPVIDGDLTDARYLDPAGVVVGLRVKGRVKDDTGFIRTV